MHGLDFDGDAVVVEQARVEVGEVGAVPRFDISGELSNDELGAFAWKGLGSRGQGEAHAEPADENTRLVDRPEWGAREISEGFFRTVGKRGHELLTMRADHVGAIVFNELKRFTFWSFGGCYFFIRFHQGDDSP